MDSKPDESCLISGYLIKYKAFKIEHSSEFKGIKHYFTNTTGSNIHGNGTVEITSKSNDNHP